MAHSNNSCSLSETEYEMVKHIIDIPDLEELRLSECSIYKVHYNLRKVNEEAYTPQWISIGPIHLDKQELNPMQEHKKRYFHCFWERVSNEQAMRNFKHHLETKEDHIRHCYADKFPDIPKEKFVDMLLLDAVFIMELLLRNCEWKSNSFKHEHEYKHTKSFRVRHSDDLILTQSWLSRNITRDMILIENQIPFFVLQKLYDDVVPGDNKKEEHTAGFVDLAIEYFAFYDTQMSSSDETKRVLDKNQSRKNYFSGAIRSSKRPYSKSKSKDRYSKSAKHFTDLIRYFYLPSDWVRNSGCALHVLRTATKLQDSGVSFEKDVERRLLDLTFEKKPILSSFLCFGCLPYLKHFKARFRIPQLKVDHTTECVFRNLIAFEQCHYPEKPYICNYVSLIDSLIHTQLDVELLVEKEVIVHELGSDKEVAVLVNGLSKHVVANTTCYYETINELNKHYQNIWNRTMAALWLVYFRDPWRASSTMVGIVVLVFAVFQFIRAARAVLGYDKF
ncbi:UPF0481 protein At3g47200-like [Glycine soja]|uniref:UPF0481 protein n=1 Tax=Glycine soja TaxID=3848 RepID=A0A0B2QG80_GLYSO|nr:UPF0481 protein At3g47200-like [Glycine soja]XP_028225076.1 UPF0481 protein At3g47200-like [Glycine soja]KHN18968.1 UPF0481 protein [Glycine soja]RZC20210.1 UPF0481 protein isoform A [Glycine soja]RZC20211.1 UPF0481 protein isoform B [Glycine soja]RZC20212.1 UPF0481 protein isoform C [Glycine soja]